MSKKRSLETKLARLAALRKEPASPALTTELRTALSDPSNFVVAEAAKAITEENGASLVLDLIAAFERFLIDPTETDKLCQAKIAIFDALNRLDYDDPTLFRKYASYTQWEPVWGGSVDRAADLRGACAIGLARTDKMRCLPILADLLADGEKNTRLTAAMALANAPEMGAVGLLRLKVRLGDKEPEVISACFSSLISLNAQEAIPFVAEFLTGLPSDECTMAILALGESRRPEALEHLTRFWENKAPHNLRSEVLLGIALLRLPEATAFLLGLIAGREDVAALAVEALAIHGHNPQVREQTAAAIASTGSRRLQSVFAAKFDRK